MGVVVGILMLIVGLAMFSQVKNAPGPVVLFMVVWVLIAIVGIGYHVLNATQEDGVPTTIIESDDVPSETKSSAERLKDLDDLRDQKLITEEEYQSKRQEILKQV